MHLPVLSIVIVKKVYPRYSGWSGYEKPKRILRKDRVCLGRHRTLNFDPALHAQYMFARSVDAVITGIIPRVSKRMSRLPS